MGSVPDRTRMSSLIRDEAVRQLVIMGFSVAGAVILLAIMRGAHGDKYIRLQMRVLLAAKHFAQDRADWWQDVAGRAATAYHRLQP